MSSTHVISSPLRMNSVALISLTSSSMPPFSGSGTPVGREGFLPCHLIAFGLRFWNPPPPHTHTHERGRIDSAESTDRSCRGVGGKRAAMLSRPRTSFFFHSFRLLLLWKLSTSRHWSVTRVNVHPSGDPSLKSRTAWIKAGKQSGHHTSCQARSPKWLRNRAPRDLFGHHPHLQLWFVMAG